MSPKKLFLSFLDDVWTIGFVNGSLNDIVEGKELKINVINHSYKDRWFADPFILDVTDTEISLLVEEFYFPHHHGRIAKLTIDKSTYNLLRSEVVLELDSHLSFPAIFRQGNIIYIYPENSAKGSLTLYSYDPINNNCHPISVIAEEPLTDAIIVRLGNDKKVLFSTKVPTMQHHLLGVYYEEYGKFIFKKNYIFKERISRGAGDFFNIGTNLYRPAQVFEKWYGRGLSIQKVTENNGEWEFEEVRRIYSNVKGYKDGIHTFNCFKNTIVVDLKHFRHPYLRLFAQFLMNCYIIMKTKIKKSV